jgi:hypothetical protein
VWRHGRGDLYPFVELEECWVLVKGIPPRWCVWEIFDQIASSYGLLEEVDWQRIFSSFYETMRMRIKCRDASKISRERLFCIDKKLYKIVITVEKTGKWVGEQRSAGTSRLGDNDDQDNFDEADDLDEDEGQDKQKVMGQGGSIDDSLVEVN